MLKRFLALLLLCFAGFPLRLGAQGELFAVSRILEKIEARRGSWTAMRAELTLHFHTENYQTATCLGKMAYQRLDEKLILQCRDARGKLHFAFKAEDRDFQLYIPAQNTVFEGSIFDLETTPEFDSYIKPLNLYRALKPMAFRTEQTMLEKVEKLWLTLRVDTIRREAPFTSRRAYVSPEGDVLKEIYYSFDTTLPTTILRSEYRLVKTRQFDLKSRVYYPQHILVQSDAAERSMQFDFTKIEFFSMLEAMDWDLAIPAGVQTVSIQTEEGAAVSLQGNF